MNKFVLLACSTASSLLLVTGSVSANGSGDEGYSIQGAWQVEVTVRLPAEDCSTAPLVPPSGPNPFPSFNVFHEGGTMNEFGSRSPPANRGPGFGVWERTGKRKYGYRNMFQSFGADGLLFGTMDITTELRLAKNGDRFKGVSRFVLTTVDGAALNFCATMTGDRFTL